MRRTSADVWRRRSSSGWLDVVLAAALLVACEAEVVSDTVGDHGRNHWPLAVNVTVVAVLTIPLAWRRRAPLTSLVMVKTGVLLLSMALADLHSVNFPQLVLFIAPYSVAAYAPRRRALLGLAYATLMLIAVNVINPSGASSWVFSVATCLGCWGLGRALRAHRALTVELEQDAQLLVAEQGSRELIAVAEQRSHIARELQALVAESVSTMVVQSQTAQRLLAAGSSDADTAMKAIENTGREALVEMRRVLGVLRDTDADVDLAPQPGVGEIPALVVRERSAQRSIMLSVDGTPGPMPASVDLGLYRIVEEALHDGALSRQPVEVHLHFGAADVELTVTSLNVNHLDWPTTAMRERAVLCQGTVSVETGQDLGARLIVRLPRVFDGAAV